MRKLLSSLLVFSGIAANALAQTCTGLCLQQVSCPNGATTTISGVVSAPNGLDPLPNVIVYIPNAPVDAFTPGVSCPVVGTPPSGSPLIATTTAVDGSFTLSNVPVGANIPLVIQTGRWRRQLIVPAVTACTDTSFSTRMPRNQGEGDIPKFAIVTGSADQVECVLRKVGIDDAEFTDASGTGRINLFTGSGSPGARVDAATTTELDLMGASPSISNYDVLMLPCQGSNYAKTTAELANLIQFANTGGRVYSSHYSYSWMYKNPPFDKVASWTGNSTTLPDGLATVDTSFSEGNTLADWLQLVGASTTRGQIAVSTVRRDFNGVVAPTQSYLALNDAAAGNPVMQFVFDAPVGNVINQCGRVLFNEYHVENPTVSPAGKAFPAECPPISMTPQEKLLEYSIFELTNDGGQATLTPAVQDFGSQPIGFNSNAQTFVWKNNSTFPAVVSSVSTSGDFAVAGNGCGAVAPGNSCQVNVVFKPTAIGVRAGKLVVGTSSSTLTSTLSGTGIPDLSVSFANLDFGNVDVGASKTQSIVVTNSASGPVVFPGLLVTGAFSATSSCGNLIAGLAACSINVTFAPTTYGPQTGSLALNSSNPAYPITPTVLTGNGVDFTFSLSPASGATIAGHGSSTTTTTTPLAGFNAPVQLSCTTTAPGTTCVPSATSFIPSSTVATGVTITTTSQYTVIGYGGTGSSFWLLALALGSGGLLWINRRRAGKFVRLTVVGLVVATLTFPATGCSGKLPAQNPGYTVAGDYTFTLTATDGFITHSATYSLKVTAR